jgi:glycosyltransferase involved in cell wall biosynthesis
MSQPVSSSTSTSPADPATPPLTAEATAGPASDLAAPRISVLMPVYNGEAYLDEAIRSILSQTFADFEFLIMDDGSTDRTPAILDRIAAADRRIRVFRRENRGIIATLNELLELARAELIARMDADDIALPHRFAEQVRYLDENPDCVLVASSVVLIDPDGSDLTVRDGAHTHEEINRALLETGGQIIYHPATMMRRQALLDLGGYRSGYFHAEDLDLFLRLGEVGRLVNLPEPLLKYREHLGKVGAVHAQLQGEVVRRVLLEAHERRGLTPPESIRQFAFRPTVPAEKFRIWGWWALASGHVATARKHALASLRRQPFAWPSWKLLACTLRGR